MVVVKEEPTIKERAMIKFKVKVMLAMREMTQKELAEKTGPVHDQTFVVYVNLGDKKYGPAKAKSKKDAEQIAAKMALDSIS